MTHFVDIMVDIETLDLAPTAAVVSIGAVRFYRDSPDLGEELHVRIDLRDAVANGTVSGSTLAFWFQQDAEAQREMHGDTPIGGALIQLYEFIRRQTCNNGIFSLCIWSQGSMDINVLTHAYGKAFLTLPWPYRAPRDSRTLFDVTGIDLASFTAGVRHNALDDAKCQARAAYLAFQSIPRLPA